MFAVAVWDRLTRALTLARDPLGIKPLYFSEQAEGFAFASELKAIRLLPNHEFTIDERAVADYFQFGHVRRPRSIFEEVRTLDPGCFLTIGAEGESSAHRYWEPQFRGHKVQSDRDWIEEMRSIFEATCRRHMMADVPVAAFLSGGIDSSSVLAAMVSANRSPIQAFTISHPGHSIDEADAATRIAQYLGCQHIVSPLEAREAMHALPSIAASYDEPFADMAAIPTWFVSKMAARSVKVVLCGEGGDELFCGYKRHRNADVIARNRPLVSLLRPIAQKAGRIPAVHWSRFNRVRQYAERFGEFAASADGYRQFFLATRISSRAVFDRVASPRLKQLEASPRELEQAYFAGKHTGSSSALDDFVYADLTLNLPSDMLTRLDRASMAHSLEARVPFLSHKLVDWALSVPTRLKLHRGVGKYILREAARPWLPAEILKLPKQGFQIPMASWLTGGEFADFALETCVQGSTQSIPYLSREAVLRLFDEHRTSAYDHSRLLYAILMFSIWWNKVRGSSALIENRAN
jgi:asparagine synthase (glutamine-hydrolysing)